MGNKVTIFDYGMGNLRSVQKALEQVGADTLLTDQKADVLKAEKLVVPGVGAFGDSMANLKKLDVIEPYESGHHAQRVP